MRVLTWSSRLQNAEARMSRVNELEQNFVDSSRGLIRGFSLSGNRPQNKRIDPLELISFFKN